MTISLVADKIETSMLSSPQKVKSSKFGRSVRSYADGRTFFGSMVGVVMVGSLSA